MRAAVVVFPGSNRDADVTRALTLAGANVTKVWHADSELPAGTASGVPDLIASARDLHPGRSAQRGSSAEGAAPSP